MVDVSPPQSTIRISCEINQHNSTAAAVTIKRKAAADCGGGLVGGCAQRSLRWADQRHELLLLSVEYTPFTS
jgi:hypothetical protein